VLEKIETMSQTNRIIPETMRNIVDRAGYLPALRSGDFVFCAGQVGRDADLRVIANPAAQFEACWDNLALVLESAGCTFKDVVEITTFHVGMSRHMNVFRQVKERRFPRATCPWTCVGVSELAHQELLVEIKCIARKPQTT